ncbi:pitrilysin family protein [Microbispora sp. NBRC 16548]|uniref:M16 family metallopeptidase n=1 Tax=Microbispora sp. NBRC 16548 TaxID=3030994 RepID=UPI0024A0B6D2|nr:pitrilysin family protein [Microbispora sp. NBRC 16548]GLX05631.1 peptidase M16 [Microbispora sp. NBRC 16548]
MSATPLHRLTLSNGLRVILQPIPDLPTVGVSVHYNVGFRSEPADRTGFAHLFEHLMFQGSRNVRKLEHFRRIQAAGGSANGSTHQDYTDYYQVVPSSALELVLYLEADRMLGPDTTAENLLTQVDVVKEEIRLNVTNRPYGGYPWTVLPGVLFSSYANAHNGYGDFEDLESATLAECEAFFDTYYGPGNAVLTIAGGFEPQTAAEMVERWFGDVPARPAPPRPTLAEPPLTRERWGEHHDAHAPLPALAAGHRLPDPAAARRDYLAHMVLSSILTGSDNGRLTRRMVHRDQLVVDVRTGCGLFGAFEARDPDVFLMVATHSPATRPEQILGALDEELDDLARRGPQEAELAQATARMSAGTYRTYDGLAARTRALGAFEVLHGAAELVDELPALLTAVNAEQVGRAAGALLRDARAVLPLVPAGSRANAA